MEATFEITELIFLIFWIRNLNAVRRGEEVYQNHMATQGNLELQSRYFGFWEAIYPICFFSHPNSK